MKQTITSRSVRILAIGLFVLGMVAVAFGQAVNSIVSIKAGTGWKTLAQIDDGTWTIKGTTVLTDTSIWVSAKKIPMNALEVFTQFDPPGAGEDSVDYYIIVDIGMDTLNPIRWDSALVSDTAGFVSLDINYADFFRIIIQPITGQDKSTNATGTVKYHVHQE